MEEFIQKIHEYEEFKNLKLLKVVYDTTFCVCTIYFIYPEKDPTFKYDQKLNLSEICKQLLNINGKVEVKLYKSYLDETVIRYKLKAFIEENFTSLKYSIDLDKMNIKRILDEIKLEFTVGPTVNLHLHNSNFIEVLTKFLNDNFCAKFYVDLIEDKSLEFDDNILNKRKILIDEALENLHKVERYDVFDPQVLIGSDIATKPEYIKNIKEEKSSVILAGVVSNLIEKQYLPRRNKNKGIDEKYNYYTFKISDIDAKCSAIYFANKTTVTKFSQIADGSSILALGDLKKNTAGELCYHIKEVSFCRMPSKEELCKDEEQNALNKAELTDYKIVHPREFIQLKQDNLFYEKQDYPENILNKTYVVFDTETTGLSSVDNELTEIGAVKIQNGKITQVFQTLIKPKSHIPAEISKITGITDDMVKDSPCAEDVIKDFYLFSKDCTLVGHNIDFDYQFIQTVAKRTGLYFGNDKLDTLLIARSKLYLSNYKLGTIVNYLNLELTNAHRALFDATATAEVFLKLSLLKGKDQK